MTAPAKQPDIAALRAEAQEWLKTHGPSGIAGPWVNRSCWNCNSAHEHLKDADFPFECLFCGHIYYKGVQLAEGPEAHA